MSFQNNLKKNEEESAKYFTFLTSCKIVLKEIYPQLDFTYDGKKTRSLDWYEFENNSVSYFLKCSNGNKESKFNFNKIGCEIDSAYCICRFDTEFIVFQVTGCRDHDKIVISFENNTPNVKGCSSSKQLPPIKIDISYWSKHELIQDRISSIISRAKTYDKEIIKKLLEEQNQHCFYCGITQEQIKELDDREKNIQSSDQLYLNLLREDELNKNPGLTKRDHRKILEVDQKNPHGGYVEGNIVLACSWCNNAKTDTFTCDEFKEIAKGINTVWNQRLGGKGFDDIIKFPKSKPCCQTK